MRPEGVTRKLNRNVRTSGNHKRSGEQRTIEDGEIELKRRRGKEASVSEFEGALMSIDMFPGEEGRFVWIGK